LLKLDKVLFFARRGIQKRAEKVEYFLNRIVEELTFVRDLARREVSLFLGVRSEMLDEGVKRINNFRGLDYGY
jgi:hypothetical protein